MEDERVLQEIVWKSQRSKFDSKWDVAEEMPLG